MSLWIPESKLETAKQWLTGSGKLRTAENAPYWNARVTGATYAPRDFEGGYDAAITFQLSPFRYIASDSVTLTGASYLSNPESVFSEPLMTITGSGEASITIGSQMLYLHGFPEGGQLIINTERQECYWGDTTYNNLMEGAFPVLEPGTVAVSWTGGITQITVDRRLRRI